MICSFEIGFPLKVLSSLWNCTKCKDNEWDSFKMLVPVQLYFFLVLVKCLILNNILLCCR